MALYNECTPASRQTARDQVSHRDTDTLDHAVATLEEMQEGDAWLEGLSAAGNEVKNQAASRWRKAARVLPMPQKFALAGRKTARLGARSVDAGQDTSLGAELHPDPEPYLDLEVADRRSSSPRQSAAEEPSSDHVILSDEDVAMPRKGGDS